MDNDTVTDVTAEAVPAQRSPGGADAAVPLAGCQCRDCQGVRFI